MKRMKRISLGQLLAILVSTLILPATPSAVVGQLLEEQDKDLITIAKQNLEEVQADFVDCGSNCGSQGRR